MSRRRMGIETLTQWLSLATQTTSPLALSLVQLRAFQIGSLVVPEDGIPSDLAQRLCAPRKDEILDGLCELKTRLDQGDPGLVARYSDRLGESSKMNEALAHDAQALQFILGGGSEKSLQRSVIRTAHDFNRIAEAHHREGRLEIAEHLYLRAQTMAEAGLPHDHRFFRILLSNRAAVHYASREFDHAEFLCRRAMKITEKVLGTQHPDYARCLVNLAEICKSKGQVKIARRLLDQALTILRRALGSRHPEVIRLLQRRLP